MSQKTQTEKPRSGFVDRMVRKVFFTMVFLPEGKWIRVGKCYGSREYAKQWVPFVRCAWRGLRVKVAQCTLRWRNGEITEASRKTLSEKFNMEPPDSFPNAQGQQSLPAGGDNEIKAERGAGRD
jgi:hypothetical protein